MYAYGSEVIVFQRETEDNTLLETEVSISVETSHVKEVDDSDYNQCMFEDAMPLHTEDLLETSVMLDVIQRRLITYKDMQRIHCDFKTSHSIHMDELTSVDFLVKRNMQEDYNCVLVYKPVGVELERYPNIEKDAFLLGISTEGQLEYLQTHGPKCVMVDTTYGTNQHRYNLTTVMVQDFFHLEVIPVAVYFSKSQSADVFKPLCDAIKLNLPDFETNVIMTDDTNIFVNAWNESFQKNPRHLICSNHLMSNILKLLNLTVKNSQVRANMKNDLMQLLYELDFEKFQEYLVNFFRIYQNEESFVSYFQEKYVSQQEKWAYCHRANLKMYTNTKLIDWIRKIRCKETDGLITNRLDQSLYFVLDAMSETLQRYWTTVIKPMVTNRITMIKKKHRDSKDMDEQGCTVEMDKGSYIVREFKDLEKVSYNVKIKDLDCKCPNACDDCKICIHSVYCSCNSYTQFNHMCKHIHFVCQKLESKEIKATLPTVEDRQVTEKEISKIKETDVTLQQVPKRPRLDLEGKRLAIVQNLLQLSSEVASLESMEQIVFVDEMV